MNFPSWSIAIADEATPPKQPYHTILSLRLDLEAARAGKTWLLLPEGFRDNSCGLSYPLPTDRTGLQTLATIDIPNLKKDAGCVYLRRALRVWKNKQGRKQSALLDTARRVESISRAQETFQKRIAGLREEAIAAVEGVRKEAERAVANLNDLFVLGRKGIEGQMRAHLENALWQGEQISASAFRECFRMVAQAVKGLGLPSEQRDAAAEAVLEEIAASIRDTQEVVGLAVDPEPTKTEH